MKFLSKKSFVMSLMLLSSSFYLYGMDSGDAVEDSLPPAQKIAEYVKKIVAPIDAKEMSNIMKNEYHRMFLIDEKGQWTSDVLKKYEEELLPRDLTKEKINGFIDQMAQNTLDNPIITDFLKSASSEDLGAFGRKVEREGATVLPRAVATALVFNALTHAQVEHLDLLQEVNQQFKRTRQENGINFFSMLRSGSLGSAVFETAKLTTVEGPLETFIKVRESGKIEPQFARYLLPINIYEAYLGDYFYGKYDNAASCVPLMNNPPGIECEESIGGGLAEVVGNVVKLHYPLTKKWDDLYQSWNAAFITKFNACPFIITKLLIPEVSGYKNHPEDYVYKRAIALYLYLHYDLFGDLQDRKNGVTPVAWPIGDKLSLLWGKVNKEWSKCYSDEVCKARAENGL